MPATVTLLLSRTRRAVRRRLALELSAHSDRPLRVLQALHVLSDEAAPTQAFLAAQLDLDAPAASRLVGALESDGLIARAPGEDRRCRVLRITSKGRRVLVPVHRVLLSLDRNIERILGRPRARTLEQLLHGLLEGLEADATEAVRRN